MRFEAAIEVLMRHSPKNHFLWNDKAVFASPTKHDFIEKIRAKGIDALGSDEWNALMFSCAYTIGDERSFDFLLPRFLEGVFSKRIAVIHFDLLALQSKLDYLKYQNWPAEKKAAIEGLLEIFSKFDESAR